MARNRYECEVRYENGWMGKWVYADSEWEAEKKLREEAKRIGKTIIEIKKIRKH